MTGFQLARLALVSNCRLALASNWRDLARTLLVCRNLKYTKRDRTEYLTEPSLKGAKLVTVVAINRIIVIIAGHGK